MKKLALHLVGPLLFILAWEALAVSGTFNELLLPGPIETLSALIELLGGSTIWTDIFATVWRVLLALLIAVAFGVPLGLLLGSSDKIYQSAEFLVDFFRSMPATAIFPVFLLIFGIADSSKVAVATFGALLVILFNTAHGIMNASKLRRLVAKTLGAEWYRTFTSVLFWESLPQTFVGLRIALNFCLIIVVVTEMFIGTTEGLGRRIIDFQIIYEIDAMYAVIIVTGILGYLFNSLFARLQAHVVHWTN